MSHGRVKTLPDFHSKISSTTVVFVGHGSRVKKANEELELIVNFFKEQYSDLRVVHCYIELAKPSFNLKIFEEASRLQCKRLIILPVFLFSSKHVKNDLPIILSKVQSNFPAKEIICADAMKSSSKLVELAYKRIKDVCDPLDSDNGLLVVGRGSSDPDSNGEFEKIVRLIYEKGNFSFALSSAIGISTPTVSDQIKLISRLRPKRLIIFPYFLFHGRLIENLWKKIDEFKETHSWIEIIRAKELGVDRLLVEYFAETFEKLISGDLSNSLPCNTCHYRSEIGDIATKVNGVEALLWSVRHLYTHSQAKPHEYPHANIKKHVLICENVDCANRGSKSFARALRKNIKADGKLESIKVTKTSCMGRCGEGPALVVYPDGVWYRNVELEDIDKIYNDHLLNDKIVEERVDDIMI